MEAEPPTAGAESPASTPLDRWLAARRGPVLAVLLVAAALLRGLFFAQLAEGPCIEQHRWDVTDMHAFDAWGRAIADGDWLSRELPYPLYVVHRALAQEHYREHPEALAALGESGAPSEAAMRALWDRLAFGDHFYQDPLYPYLLGTTYALGAGPRAVYVWQLLLGLLTVPLVVALGRRIHGETAGVFAGLLFVLSGPVLHYELTLLRATTLSFAGLGTALLLLRAADGERLARWAAAGVALGLCLWLKASFQVLALGTLLWATVLLFPHPRALVRCGAALLLGIAVGFSPVVARNLTVGTPALETASGGRMTFAVSNNAGCSAENGFLATRGMAGVLDEAPPGLLPVARATVDTHGGFGGWLALVGAKLAAVLRGRELANNTNFYFYRRHAPVLAALPITFFVLAPLAVLGLVVCAPRWRSAGPLAAVAASHLAVLLLFYVYSRYRIPLATALVPFAGAGAASLARWIGGRRAVPSLLGLAAVAGAAALTLRPNPGDPPLVRLADYQAPYIYHWDPEASRAEAAGDWARAAELFARSLRVEPAEIAPLGPGRAADGELERGLAQLYATVYTRYARALQGAGAGPEASAASARARELANAAR
ncbi:MAG: glycosyltransferase family 39 protein [Planctomycetota bacterium]